MAKTPAQKAAQARYAERNPEIMRAVRRRYEEVRPPRDRAEYMREYRRRQKEKLQQQQEGETG